MEEYNITPQKKQEVFSLAEVVEDTGASTSEILNGPRNFSLVEAIKNTQANISFRTSQIPEGHHKDLERLKQYPAITGPDVVLAENVNKNALIEAREAEQRANENIQELNNFFSLQEKVQNRAEKSKKIIQRIKKLRKENPTDFIQNFNDSNDTESIRGLELTLIESEKETLLIIDQSGKLVELACAAENSKEVLLLVKEADENLRGNSNELRSEILKRSNGLIKTHEAYTYGYIETADGSELKAFLDNESNWTEERQVLHQEIIENELKKAGALNERLEDSEPTIYALRGGTATGKTTKVRNDPTFHKAIDAKSNPSGAINPDVYKEHLKSNERVFGQEQVTHFQCHNEGSALARKIKERIRKSDSSMIIDQRLNEAEDITVLVNEARETGKKLKFLDVDAPLENSLIRVLARRPGGADPLPPFASVTEGYEGIRKNRHTLIEQVRNNENIVNYVLYVSDENGQSVKVAEKINGKLEIIKGLEKLYDEANDGNTTELVEKLSGQIIDDAYIASATKRFKLRDFEIKSLKQYQGKTFKESLDEHSKKIDVEAPTIENYIASALINLENTSRTAKGTVDTSASTDKAQKMQEGLTGESAAELAKDNFKEALKNIYRNKQKKFKDTIELQQFIESIATTVNNGITKEGILIREGEDSPKYPYTRISELPNRMSQFYEELGNRLENPKEDPQELAAWVEFRIDLTDHFFADGCGKTSKLISSWIMMRAGKNLPDYTMGGKISADKVREEYYKNAPKTIPGTDPAKELEELKHWINYYKKLC